MNAKTFNRPNGETVQIHDVAWCHACHSFHPTSNFYKDKAQNSGITTRCKPCETVRQSQRSKERSASRQQLRQLGSRNAFTRGLVRDLNAEMQAA